MAAAEATGLELALELTELGEQLVEARVRRERPDATDDEVAAEVLAWYRTRPGAADGDCPGRVISFSE